MVVTRHEFVLNLAADGARSDGDARPQRAARRHTISAEGKPDISGSSAVVFHGEMDRWNPEELFLAALPQCHFLSYLFVASRAGLEVISYRCQSRATLEVDREGRGRITAVELLPEVHVANGEATRASALHAEAHDVCFIARSVSCEVTWRDSVVEVSPPDTQD